MSSEHGFTNRPAPAPYCLLVEDIELNASWRVRHRKTGQRGCRDDGKAGAGDTTWNLLDIAGYDGAGYAASDIIRVATPGASTAAGGACCGQSRLKDVSIWIAGMDDAQ